MTMIEVFTVFRVILYLTVAGLAFYKRLYPVGIAMLMLCGIALSRVLEFTPELVFMFSNIGGTLVAYYIYKGIRNQRF